MRLINYIDIGIWKYPDEIEMIRSDIFNLFENIELKIYGIEAYPKFAENAKNIYEGKKNIKISNIAISNKKGIEKLYISSNGIGNSIFKTKNNVDQNKYLEVNSDTLSNYIQENQIDLKNATCNILKVNIEGAELYLWEDLIKNNLHDYFHILCGDSAHDIYKVKELNSKIDYYKELLEKVNREKKFVYFCQAHKKKSITEMKNKLKELL